MNKEWSELNKLIQKQINSKSNFESGINNLFILRDKIFDKLNDLKNTLTYEDFSKMPYMNENGYHNKTIAYSIWHMFRIEDIVAHTIIKNDEQIFFRDNFKALTNSPIITTANELVKEGIADFSAKLNIEQLYIYADAVKNSTNELIKSLSYADLKRKPTEAERQRLIDSKCISENELAVWLIDYWCSKDIKGLIKMPFSRHLIMHTEAAVRIAEKLKR